MDVPRRVKGGAQQVARRGEGEERTVEQRVGGVINGAWV